MHRMDNYSSKNALIELNEFEKCRDAKGNYMIVAVYEVNYNYISNCYNFCNLQNSRIIN